jgi:hypothetical protein
VTAARIIDARSVERFASVDDLRARKPSARRRSMGSATCDGSLTRARQWPARRRRYCRGARIVQRRRFPAAAPGHSRWPVAAGWSRQRSLDRARVARPG